MLSLLFALTFAAAAGPKAPPPAPAGPGSYDPEVVAAKSATYQAFLAKVAELRADRERHAAELRAALDDYQFAIGLFDPAAVARDKMHYDAQDQRWRLQNELLGGRFDGLLVSAEVTVATALGKALQTQPTGILTCRNTAPPAGKARFALVGEKPGCDAPDRSDDLAVRIDADTDAQAALERLLASAPERVNLDTLPQGLVGNGTRHVYAAAFVRQAKADATWTTDSATPLLDAAVGAMKKYTKAGEPVTGWCLNPVTLGGCVGEDATAALVPKLLQEKKVSAAVP